MKRNSFVQFAQNRNMCLNLLYEINNDTIKNNNDCGGGKIMESFMDKLYNKITAGSGQQYVNNMDQRKKVITENRIEMLSNLINENDSKQLECIVAVLEQESEEKKVKMNEILQAIQNTAETINQLQMEQSFQETPPSANISPEVFHNLEEHVHKENVKCYRNVQASVVEQAELQMVQTRESIAPIRIMIIILMGLSVINIGLLVVHILGLI